LNDYIVIHKSKYRKLLHAQELVKFLNDKEVMTHDSYTPTDADLDNMSVNVCRIFNVQKELTSGVFKELIANHSHTRRNSIAQAIYPSLLAGDQTATFDELAEQSYRAADTLIKVGMNATK